MSGNIGEIITFFKEHEAIYGEPFIAYVAWSVIQGLIFLHQRKVVHGEIKSENILYNKNGQIKLIDGTSTTQPDNPSIFHMAPEMLR